MMQKHSIIIKAVFVLIAVATSSADAATKIFCRHISPKSYATKIEAMVDSDQELYDVHYRTLSADGSTVEDHKVKSLKKDKELSNRKSVQFDVSFRTGGLEPEVLELPKKFNSQHKFKAGLKSLPDGWGTIDDVNTKLSCYSIPGFPSQIRK